MFKIDKKLKIIAIGAHPDDIELACGGTLAKAVENGHDVYMVVVTGVASKDHNGNIIRDDNEAKDEQMQACRILGVSNIEFLEFEDMQVPYSVELITKLDKIINDINPDIIFTHFTFDTHQDHINTSKATISAARKQNTIFLYEPITPSGRGHIPFRPQVYVDITSDIDKKINSLKAHQSQYNKYGDSWIDGVKARARFRGYESGVEFAECFEVVRMELKL